MKAYRGLSVSSVENKIVGKLDDGDIRSMGLRKKSIGQGESKNH